MSIKFVDGIPEASRRGNPSYWNSIAAALHERPGQWAEIARVSSHSKALGARQALARRDGIESTARTIDGEVVVFARAVAR